MYVVYCVIVLHTHISHCVIYVSHMYCTETLLLLEAPGGSDAQFL